LARIVARTESRISPWLRLVENTVEFSPGAPAERYHCLAQADYVTIVARTPSGLIPIVSQFRPAVGAVTWELPAGLLDPGERAEECCRRELLEEVGLVAGRVQPIGVYYPDTGRLENRLHVYAVEASEPDPAFVPEPGMTVAFLSPAELRGRILAGSFIHQLHVGALASAELHGFPLGLFAAAAAADEPLR
jgi:ADP-ribose pyrophosphatase